MHWLALALLAVLGGTFYKFSRAADQPGGEFSTHLTTAERQALVQGKVVLKTHWAYNNVWHTGYHTGPLQVELLPNGKRRFRQLGHWESHTKQGRLLDEADYYSRYCSCVKVYDQDGQLIDLLTTQPVLLNGDTIVEELAIYLNLFEATDTLAVEHIFRGAEGHRLATPSYWSYDVVGKRRVPVGWKFYRYSQQDNPAKPPADTAK